MKEEELEILKLLKKWLCKRTDGILGFKTYVTLDNIEYIDDYLKIEKWLENE